MAFIIESGNTISFAEYSDVAGRDQRLFDNNESLTDDVVEELLIRATERIKTRLSGTEWWASYFIRRDAGNTSIKTRADIPQINLNRIIGRSSDFTDLCVYTAMYEYILPMVADFGDQDNAERQKMGYYQNKAEALFMEIIRAGDWYDFDGDDSIEQSERQPGYIQLKRVR